MPGDGQCDNGETFHMGDLLLFLFFCLPRGRPLGFQVDAIIVEASRRKANGKSGEGPRGVTLRKLPLRHAERMVE